MRQTQRAEPVTEAPRSVAQLPPSSPAGWGEPQEQGVPELCLIPHRCGVLATHLPLLEHACQEGVLSSSEGQKINHQQHAQRVVLWIKASEGSEHNKRNQNKRHKS